MAVLKEKKGEKAKAAEEVQDEVKTEALEEIPAKGAKKPAEPVKEEAVKPSFFVYLGPSIRGQITRGTVYTGDRAEVEKQLAAQIEKYPRIRRLLVSDLTIVEDRINVSKPGTRLNTEYRRLVAELK